MTVPGNTRSPFSRAAHLATASLLALTLSAAWAAAQPARPLEKINFLLDFTAYGKHAPFFVAMDKGFWKDAGFGPRLAFENSGSNWYENTAQWYRANGRAFAVNFWYASLLCVSEATLDFITGRMPDAYAAMSPAEFFAELYALYHDIGDPQRKNIPADVASWLKTKLGGASNQQPARPRSAGKPPRKGLVRPRRAAAARPGV